MAPAHLNLRYMAIVCFPLAILGCSRYRRFGEPCGDYQNLRGNYPGQMNYPYPQQQQFQYQPQTVVASSQDDCDTSRYLQCDRLSGTCQCPDRYKYFWDSYQERCYIKVGYACTETFGGLSESKYSHGCPTNSYCNPGTGYCDCRPLFKRNLDYTGCSLSAAFNMRQLSQFSLILPVVIGLFYHFIY